MDRVLVYRVLISCSVVRLMRGKHEPARFVLFAIVGNDVEMEPGEPASRYVHSIGPVLKQTRRRRRIVGRPVGSPMTAFVAGVSLPGMSPTAEQLKLMRLAVAAHGRPGT
jgi:hypothetical protein